MNEESKRIVEALRHVGYGLAQGDTNCSKCPMQEIPIGELECGSDCPTTLMLMAADLIEKLSAQLVNQATEYSRALKNTTEQRDAAVHDMKKKLFGCDCCKHYMTEKGKICKLPLGERKPSFECWEWRGVLKEEPHD